MSVYIPKSNMTLSYNLVHSNRWFAKEKFAVGENCRKSRGQWWGTTRGNSHSRTGRTRRRSITQVQMCYCIFWIDMFHYGCLCINIVEKLYKASLPCLEYYKSRQNNCSFSTLFFFSVLLSLNNVMWLFSICLRTQ